MAQEVATGRRIMDDQYLEKQLHVPHPRLCMTLVENCLDKRTVVSNSSPEQAGRCRISCWERWHFDYSDQGDVPGKCQG